MSLSFRKSIRVGPFRFTLSNGGVNAAAIIPGIKWGTGPRGNYIRLGTGGLIYRKSLAAGHSHAASSSPAPHAAHHHHDLTEYPEDIKEPTETTATPAPEEPVTHHHHGLTEYPEDITEPTETSAAPAPEHPAAHHHHGLTEYPEDITEPVEAPAAPEHPAAHHHHGITEYPEDITEPVETSAEPAETTAPEPVAPATIQPVESADVATMTDSSPKELLAEILLKKQKPALLTWVLLLTPAVLIGLYFVGAPQAVLIAWIVLAILAGLAARYRDTLTKSSVLFYELDPAIESAFSRVHDAARVLGACRGSWHVTARKKRPKDLTEGIESLSTVRRKPSKFRKANPSFVRTNVPAVALRVSRQTLYFLPDRILVYEGGRVGALGYDELHITSDTIQFIEEGRTPADTKIVGKTWKYTNKFGEADKRFTNNKEYAICQYEAIHLTTDSGLNELLHISRTGLGAPLAAALHDLATALSEASHITALSDRLLRIAQNGQDLGDHPLLTVQEMIRTGSLTLDDYYFDETRNEWMPLRDFEV